MGQSSSRTAEREYVFLMFAATSIYASWEPLRPVKIGDYGKLRRNGSFDVLGNIFDEGIAAGHNIHHYTHGQDESRYIVSNNGRSVAVASNVEITLGGIIAGHWKHRVTFTKGRGALLAMLRPRLTVIANPGHLSRLFTDQPGWSDVVLVSEVYTCPSYARLLTNCTTKDVTVGLGASAPIAPTAGGDMRLQWQTNTASGDWKSAHYLPVKHGAEEDSESDEPLCYPLFKLVAPRPPYAGAPVSVIGQD